MQINPTTRRAPQRLGLANATRFPRIRQRRFHFAPRPREGRHMAQLDQVFRPAPGWQSPQRVRPNQQTQRIRVLVLEGSQRVVGIGWSRPPQLPVVRHQFRAIRDQPHHVPAMLRRSARRSAMRRMPAWNEAHLRQAENRQEFQRESAMPEMNRIEQPAKNAAHRIRATRYAGYSACMSGVPETRPRPVRTPAEIWIFPYPSRNGRERTPSP